jgi:transglutaminase-like putative cysteine protease
MGRFILWTATLLLTAALPWLSAARAEHIVHARVDRDVSSYDVHRDLTWVQVSTLDVTLFTQRGIRAYDRSAWTFYPDKQALDLVEAWVDQPDGTRMLVPSSGIFTRPSAAAQGAPGFVNSLTTTVVFPQLREGSHIHVVWRLTQKTPSPFGFDARNEAFYAWDTGVDETRITIPADLPLHWRARDFAVTDTVTDGIRHVVAQVHDLAGQDVEPDMVATEDFQPTFEATTLPDMAAMGAIIYRESKDRAAVTPEIAARAAQIVGARTGLDAARAVYDWVANNIRYIAVYQSLDDGMVSHSAPEVLHAGYGDCKDYVVLMQALLAARGIDSVPASIDWGTRYADPVSWAPFFSNHRIIYLPAYHHFANPTDRFATFDSLDPRLSGKLAILATPEGEVLRTPASTPAANSYRMQSTLTLTADGAIDGVATYEMSPNMETFARSMVSAASSMSDLADDLLERTMEGGVGQMTASDPRDLSRRFALSATWHSVHVVNEQGGRSYMRIPPGPDLLPPGFERGRISPNGTRRHPELADARDQQWTTTLRLPAGLQVDSLPDDVTMQTKAGHYTAGYKVSGNELIVARNLVIDNDVVDAASYPELERLLYAALVDARAVLVLSPAQQAARLPRPGTEAKLN